MNLSEIYVLKIKVLATMLINSFPIIIVIFTTITTTIVTVAKI